MRESKELSDNPLVSVVVPNFNNGVYLATCLASIADQSYRPIEILVVDDGSTDASVEIIKGFSDLNEINLTVIENFHYGASVARNAGIMNSKGEVIALLDSDDTWEKDKIERQVRLLLDKNLDVVYTGGKEFFNGVLKGKSFKPEFEGYCYEKFVKYPGKAIFVLGSSSVIFRKKLIERCGLFDPTFQDFAEDWDFFRRLSRFAIVGYIDSELVNYRRHSHNTSNMPTTKHFKANWRAISKMFTEDRNINFRNKVRIRFLALLNYVKSLVKVDD
jgi:glycosyltransferase involved in cell wall biosynthesis